MEEFVCADGRMSVNGVCYISKTPDRDNTILSPPPSSENKFEWDFDKVGDTVGNFNDTIKDSVTSFNSYVSEKFGVENIAKNAAIGLALGPYAIPLAIGKGVFNQFKKNKDTTDTNIQGGQSYDMMTYDVPTAGQPGFGTTPQGNYTNQFDGGDPGQSNNAGGGTFGDSVNDNNSFSDYS